ncbi:MAG: hypothetical protein A2Z83_02065 [Omnitrophica bacterium GWA2_52_8]|nr:MAG: hypothetical protein A2Z83_02065 [Omnitrophica bacterium GWA2_52_8]
MCLVRCRNWVPIITAIFLCVNSAGHPVYAQTPFGPEILIKSNPNSDKPPRIIPLPMPSIRDRSTVPPPALKAFLIDQVIPREAKYFTPGVGLDPASGVPYDHRRIRLDKGILGETGNYTAASKLSVSLAYLLCVMLQKPMLKNVLMTHDEAERLLRLSLETVYHYVKKYPDYGGFMPWVDIRPNGTVAPASNKLPSLDNGQMTWALSAILAAFEKSPKPSYRELAELARNIINSQNYKKFYDPQKKLLFGTIQKDPYTNRWVGDQTYYLNDMFEGILAVLWAVLHRHVPEEVWYELKIPTSDYVTSQGEVATTFHGYRASFHEHWALVFLPLMDTSLREIYQNFLYAQADFAQRTQMPGFLSTAYSPRGIYRQMGIPSIASQPVDQSDAAVVYATAMGMLISPWVGSQWLEQLYRVRSLLTPYGAVESVGRDGYADIFTADAKGLTVLSAVGGVVDEVNLYLRRRVVPGTRVPMDVKFRELVHAKYLQMLKERSGNKIYLPEEPYAAPPKKIFDIKPQKMVDPGLVFDISGHLQQGHLHGKNATSPGIRTLEDDVRAGKPFAFDFEIPEHYAYFDQWAFRGTYIDRAVAVNEMRFLSFTIPAYAAPNLYEIEIKSDGITLANTLIKTTDDGILSADGEWKTIMVAIDTVPEAEYKPFNYFAVAIHDPRYLPETFRNYGREGTVVIKDIRLLKNIPVEWLRTKPDLQRRLEQRDTGTELIRYWHLSHGDLNYQQDPKTGSYLFLSGLGWRGGYLPYMDLSKFRYLRLKIRNLSGECNRFYVELKNESQQILGFKAPLLLYKDASWNVYEVELPYHIKLNKPLNYFAVSDPYQKFELGSISLGNAPLNGLNVKRVRFNRFNAKDHSTAPRCPR